MMMMSCERCFQRSFVSIHSADPEKHRHNQFACCPSPDINWNLLPLDALSSWVIRRVSTSVMSYTRWASSFLPVIRTSLRLVLRWYHTASISWTWHATHVGWLWAHHARNPLITSSRTIRFFLGLAERKRTLVSGLNYKYFYGESQRQMKKNPRLWFMESN